MAKCAAAGNREAHSGSESLSEKNLFQRRKRTRTCNVLRYYSNASGEPLKFTPVGTILNTKSKIFDYFFST